MASDSTDSAGELLGLQAKMDNSNDSEASVTHNGSVVQSQVSVPPLDQHNDDNTAQENTARVDKQPATSEKSAAEPEALPNDSAEPGAPPIDCNHVNNFTSTTAATTANNNLTTGHLQTFGTCTPEDYDRVLQAAGELSDTIRPWPAVQTEHEKLKDIHLLPQEVIDSELALKDEVITSEPQRIQNSCAGAQSDCEVPSWNGVDGQGGRSYDRDTLGGCCSDWNCTCTADDCEAFCEACASCLVCLGLCLTTCPDDLGDCGDCDFDCD